MERTPKGKKKNRVASVFCILLACLFILETIILNIIWIPEIIKNTQSDAELVVFSRENPGLEAADEAAAICLRTYIYARLLEEEMLRYEENTEDYSEFAALAAETTNAWAQCSQYCDTLSRMADILTVEESKPGYCNTYGESLIAASETKEFKLKDPFAMTAYAKEENETLKYAQTISNVFDCGPRGQKLKYLADYLGTDARGAKEALDNAQALVFDNSLADAEYYHKWYIGCRVAATTGKVCAVVASGGAAAAAGGAIMSAGLVIAGADAAVSVGATACDITLGSNHTVTKALDKAEEVTGIIAACSGVGTYKNANSVDKLLTVVGVTGDAAQGKILGGAVDVDMTGEVKVLTMTVREDQTDIEKKEFRKSMQDRMKQEIKNSKGKKIFNEDTAESIAEGVETLMTSDETKEDRELANIPKEELDKLVEENKPTTSPEETMERMNQLEETLNTASAEGTMIDITEEDVEVVVVPTLEQLDGAWEVNLSFSDINSPLVDAIAEGLDSTFGEGTADAAITYYYDENTTLETDCYMNIEAISDKKAKVTLITDNDGEWSYSEYDGEMDYGTMTLKLNNYTVSDNAGINSGIDKLVLDFYGYGEQMYTSGSYEYKSFTVNTDIDYSGQLISKNEYWEFAGE